MYVVEYAPPTFLLFFLEPSVILNDTYRGYQGKYLAIDASIFILYG